MPLTSYYPRVNPVTQPGTGRASTEIAISLRSLELWCLQHLSDITTLGNVHCSIIQENVKSFTHLL